MFRMLFIPPGENGEHSGTVILAVSLGAKSESLVAG